MSQPSEGHSEAAGPAISDREDLTGSLTEQRGRVSRLREAGAADYEIRPAVKALESLLRSVILEQGARLGRLRSDSAGQAQCEEAVARLQALKAEFQEVSGKVWRDVREEGPSYAEIRDQRARVTKLREDKAAESEIRKEVDKLRSLLSEEILAQLSLVMELRSDRAWKSVIAEAERRLEELKAEFLADTGKEWSDMRAEGPVLLTTNEVRGSEVRPELKLELKLLTGGNVLR